MISLTFSSISRSARRRSFSAAFARSVATELKSAARLHKNPLRSAGFRVLKAPDVPSVLIELGYVSNAADLKQLISDQWRSRTSDAVTQAVHTYFTTRFAGGAGRPPTMRRYGKEKPQRTELMRLRGRSDKV